ncbi:MAG: glycosyltransferase [Ignavibacteriae bacterium]|nr:glycosyltransferase [Ignavibacteriota bacterium]
MAKPLQHLRVALVHDWLTGMRGGEKVLEVFCELFPQATLYTLLHTKGTVSGTIERMAVKTSFVQHLPFTKARYRHYLPLFPTAIETFDLSSYDLVVSISHCVAKGVIPPAKGVHICYCNTPMRYVWDLYDDYFGGDRAGWLTRKAMSFFAPGLRAWDVQTSGRVHYYIANSHFVSERIHRIYGRGSDVIHPPVDVGQFNVSKRHDGYYLVVSALVPYKRVDLAVEAFNKTGERLVIVGTGPEMTRLKSLARPNIEFLGWQDGSELARFYAGCQALIFPGVEDFGIVPLEAMASGKPIIAYAKGGALETVAESGRYPTGIFFHEQTVDALIEALAKSKKKKWNPASLRKHAERFDRGAFKQKILQYVEEKVG